MTHQVTITHSRAVIRKVVGRFWRRFIGLRGLLAIAGSAALLIGLLIVHDQSWMIGAVGVLFLVLITMAAKVYFVFLTRSLTAFDRMTNKTVQFTFTEDRIGVASELGNSDLTWRAIQKIWRFPEAWLLFTGKNNYLIFPIADVDQATQSFILAQVAKHGGVVR